MNKRKEFFIQEAIPNLFYTPNKEACKPQIELLIDSANSMSSECISAATRGMRDRLDNKEVVLEKNVVIIQGEFDPIISLSQMQKNLNERVEFHVIRNCGHMSIWEKRPELTQIIKQLSL